ncbi:hypothetical protein ILUMI_11670 [Ignelater luminosus]|uniref:Peptidase M14 domain-containing protein n=1 Tax=Ignelater luminosus TaxID=2038154 RepID=A0A8K0GCI1_IGNLU|nr:hypothetical protein ILUMI_11670 [Ignelater luminosus]
MTFRYAFCIFLIFISNFKYLRTDNMYYDDDPIETENTIEATDATELNTLFINLKTPKAKTTKLTRGEIRNPSLTTTTETVSETTVLETKTEATFTSFSSTKSFINASTTPVKSGTSTLFYISLPSFAFDDVESTLAGSTLVSSRKHEEKSTAKHYVGYSIVSIKPASPEQLNEILAFELIGREYLFWSHRRVLDSPLTVVLPPNETDLRIILREHRVDYKIVLEEFQISFKDPDEDDATATIFPMPSLIAISFNVYLRYNFIMEYLEDLTKRYPEIARLIRIGKTVEDRNITLIEIKSFNSSNGRTGSILVEAGMHAREWLGVSVALYTIHELVEHAAANTDMLDGLVWYVLPVLNADGYEYSHTIDRYWKNNRRQYGDCYGVDLDRNFFTKQNIKDRSSQLNKYYCTDLYPGEKAVSEPEIRALVNFIKSKKDIKAYLSLHSGEAFIAYPWAYKNERTTEYEDVAKLAAAIKTAIESKDNSSEFAIGRLNLLCGQYEGAAIDWAKKQGIDFPLMISFKGGILENFDVKEDNLFETVVASFEGIHIVPQFLRNPQSIIIIKRKDNTYDNSNEIRSFSVYAIIWLVLRFFVL